MTTSRSAQGYAPGEAQGPALVLAAPVSFWGGVDVATGRIVDRAHPDRDACVTGTVLVMAGGRGSSSSSAVLAEMIRLRTAPAAIVLAAPDPILTVGAIVADTLYGLRCPIVVCPVEGLTTGQKLCVEASGAGPAAVKPAIVV
jgi:predicted aconitase with swiveling domain